MCHQVPHDGVCRHLLSVVFDDQVAVFINGVPHAFEGLVIETLKFEQVTRANALQLPGIFVKRHDLVQGADTETLLAKNTVQ